MASQSEACKRLFPLIEQVNDLRNPVETVSKADTAYFFSADEWRAPWRQPISRGPPSNAERLPLSIADTGRTKSRN